MRDNFQETQFSSIGLEDIFEGPPLSRKGFSSAPSEPIQFPTAEKVKPAKKRKVSKVVAPSDRSKSSALVGLGLGLGLWVIGLFGSVTLAFSLAGASKWPWYFQIGLGLVVGFVYWKISESETYTLTLLIKPSDWRNEVIPLASGLFFVALDYLCCSAGILQWFSGKAFDLGAWHVVLVKNSPETIAVSMVLGGFVALAAEPVVKDCWERVKG